MDLNKQIKELEEEAKRLEEKKKELEEKKKLREVLDEKLEQFFSESNFASPKDLAEALIEKYGIRLNTRKSGGTRRKRTTIIAELRDEVKRRVRSGISMNAVSKEMEISYAVVVKIMKGTYDHLIPRSKASSSSTNDSSESTAAAA